MEPFSDPFPLGVTPFPCRLTTGGVDVSTLASIQRETRWYGAGGPFRVVGQKPGQGVGESGSFPIEEFSLLKTLQIDTCGSNDAFFFFFQKIAV